ncbi:beta-ketoacyl-ACP synthase III [Streptomyces griseoruber]|uniref:Beta-ketoacyl-[acyl-carrier-protein] synthase III n=1 Tax=Streptomyces griseoruber TaxID=1943 RepID=A0A101SIW6_9ACTN|nr:beta-ketoacyl-ACP synthase III [Streptomyces griseoruber]KUN75065.1 3-oxoacyl-ACP synthase [Streptomyces griseoruber]
MERAAVVAGLGGWVPPTVVSNDQLAEVLDTSDEWIRRRTGIRERRWVSPGQSTGDLAVEAGRRALASAGLEGVDAVVLATSSPDRHCPATAPEVATRLGLGPVPAFDVAAVCTGFVYALATGAGLVALGAAETVLVVGADAFSTLLAPDDRSTRVIFGDGGGAVVLRAGSSTEPGALTGLNLGSDGSLSDLIEVPAGGSRQRSTGVPAKTEDTYFTMQGQTVYAQAVRRMAESVQETVERTGWNLAEIDSFVLHQANARILAAVARRLGRPPERFLSNIETRGNTVAASIPLALADGVASGELRPGHKVVLAGFGGGLTWGSMALVWPRLAAHRTVSPEPAAAATEVGMP